ncbi:MAG: hypothetical protein OXH65_02170 [Paracoccaceae bacterium]|nr:hypothetical protein [Paracoccaceae bacterium]
MKNTFGYQTSVDKTINSSCRSFVLNLDDGCRCYRIPFDPGDRVKSIWYPSDSPTSKQRLAHLMYKWPEIQQSGAAGMKSAFHSVSAP